MTSNQQLRNLQLPNQLRRAVLAVALLFALPLAEANETPKPPEPAKAAEAPKSEKPADAHQAPPPEGTPAAGEANGPALRKPGTLEVDCRTFNKNEANICPRRVMGSKIAIVPVKPFTESTWDYSKYRYTLMLYFASWSNRSTEIATRIRSRIKKFNVRQIGVIGLASHDSHPELEKWQSNLQPGFPLGILPIEALKREKNPKIPSLWVVSSTGHVVTRVILPSNADAEELMNKLEQWTDF